jgi:hypothetical protein
MRKTAAYVLFIIISMACKSTKNIAPSFEESKISSKETMTSSPVNFVVLYNYAVNSSVPLTDSVNHKFIVTAEEFHKTFHMTKASPGKAIIPDFNSQYVVAIILQPTQKVVSIDIHKAEISDHDLNIYYAITDTTSWQTYPHTIKAAAALPKIKQIKQVNFYRNEAKEKTVLVGY